MKENFEKNKLPSPEEFFKEINILEVDPDEFLRLRKKVDPDLSDERILQASGSVIKYNGKITILVRKDRFPDIYRPYLITHEKWEGYALYKGGYNLWKSSIRNYRDDKKIGQFSDQDIESFLGEVNNYNYSFSHEFAIYKEYEHANNDGKLDEYHNWFLSRRNDLSNDWPQFIKNDTEIRESIYKKIKNGTPHKFLRI